MIKEYELPCLWCGKTVKSITGKQLHGVQSDHRSCSYKHMRKRAVHYQRLNTEKRKEAGNDKKDSRLDGYELSAIDSGYY